MVGMEGGWGEAPGCLTSLEGGGVSIKGLWKKTMLVKKMYQIGRGKRICQLEKPSQ